MARVLGTIPTQIQPQTGGRVLGAITPEISQAPQQSLSDKIWSGLSQPTFKATGQESILEGAAKTIGNIPSSAIGFGKSIFDFFNPIETVKKAQQIGTEIAGAEQEGVKSLDVIKGLPKATYETVVPQFVQSLVKGDIEGARAKIEEDPVGQIAPFLLLAKQVATKLGKGAEFDAGINKITKPVIEPVKTAISATGKAISGTTKFATAQFTGLNPSTIKTIIKNPNELTAAEKVGIDRASLANEVKSKLDTRIEELSATGKQYEGIRNLPDMIKLDRDVVREVLNKEGLDYSINEKGKIDIIKSAESTPLKSGDISALEDFISQYGKETELSSNAFLNTRKALDVLAKYDTSKTDASSRIARELRTNYDEIGKSQLPGLEGLDTKYAPEVRLLKKVKKEYLESNGELKSSALNKIANLTGVGKDITINRLEQIVPDIRQRVQLLKALEDIEVTKGQKVGTYLRGGIGGYAVSGGNPVIAILSAIVASPSVAVPLLKAFGRVKGIGSSVIDNISGKLKTGKVLTDKETLIVKEATESHLARKLRQERFQRLVIDRTKKDIPINPKEIKSVAQSQYNETLALYEEQLANHPARELIKYISKTTGELPEVLGGIHGGKGAISKFGIKGDDMITEMGFTDVNEAQQALTDYKKLQRKYKEYKEDKEQIIKDFEDEIDVENMF